MGILLCDFIGFVTQFSGKLISRLTDHYRNPPIIGYTCYMILGLKKLPMMQRLYQLHLVPSILDLWAYFLFSYGIKDHIWHPNSHQTPLEI